MKESAFASVEELIRLPPKKKLTGDLSKFEPI